jgi:guanylate kinase
MNIQDFKIPIVLAIVGPSGCGKTTVAKWLNDNHYCNTIISYTTRPMRDDEVNGVDHYFVTENEMPKSEDMMAYTLFGGYHYWTTFNQLKNDTYNAYVIDERGLIDLYKLDKAHKIRVIWCQMERPNNPTDSDRIKRDDIRKESQITLEELGYKPDTILVNDGDLNKLYNQIKLRVFNQFILGDVKNAMDALSHSMSSLMNVKNQE